MWNLDSASHLIFLRSASLFIPILLLFLVLSLKAMKPRQVMAIFLSFFWGLGTLALLNPILVHFGYWSFHVAGGVFVGTPVDFLFGWALMWSVLPVLIAPGINWVFWAGLLFVVDMALMPLLAPAVELESFWWLGDIICLAVSFVPSLYIYRWSEGQKRLSMRNLLQMLLFGTLFVGVLPLIILENAGTGFKMNQLWPVSHLGITLQAFIGVCLLGLSATQEFSLRGEGTPFPLDPTGKLVTTGPYAYIRNPMQLTHVLLLLFLASFFWDLWFVGAAIVSWVYSVGFAGWNESNEMETRFPEVWNEYQGGFKNFWPRWKPWRKHKAALFIDSEGCDLCASLVPLIHSLGPVKLEIKPAGEYAELGMKRMVYKDFDGFEESGIRAISRVLEHVNFVWAFIGFFFRLPGISQCSQVLLDVLAPPHEVCRVLGNHCEFEGPSGESQKDKRKNIFPSSIESGSG